MLNRIWSDKLDKKSVREVLGRKGKDKRKDEDKSEKKGETYK